jgi:predicted transcriptional regulator
MITLSSHTKKKVGIEALLSPKARIKILKVLALKPDLTIAEITKMTKLDNSKATYHLNFLKSINIVEDRRFGRANKYRFNSLDPKARRLKDFIVLWEKDK